MEKNRILVVDDEPDIVITIKYMLEHEGYMVSTASDGEEALHKVKDDKPHLIILDLRLPKLPGEQVCKKIRKDEEISDIPIIMLTAKDSDVDKVVGKVIGANCYLTKPFDMDELLQLIKGMIKERYAQQD